MGPTIESFTRPCLSVSVRQYTQLERSCLTSDNSPCRINVALDNMLTAAATLGRVASCQRDVREQSRVVYYNGNIITLFGV